MKNTGICPKCGGSDIRIVDGFVGRYGEGNSIVLGLTVFSSIKKNTYICYDCGFSEEWIDEDDLYLVEKKARKR